MKPDDLVAPATVLTRPLALKYVFLCGAAVGRITWMPPCVLAAPSGGFRKTFPGCTSTPQRTHPAFLALPPSLLSFVSALPSH